MPTALAGERARAHRTCSGLAAVLVALLMLPPFAAGADTLRLVSIATGARTGVYYFAGGQICDLVNAGRWTHGIRCLSETTGGSIDNLRRLRAGKADFAIVQSDWLSNAAQGIGPFEAAGADTRLRTVVAIYPEAFTVVARPDSGIARLSDLAGKRIDIGGPGSGSRATMEVVMAAVGWDESDFASLSGIAVAQVPKALCDGELDAAIYMIAHPNLAVENMVTSCDAKIVPVASTEITQLIAEHPYYFAYDIPARTYPGQPATVPVFAVAATLVTSTRTPPSVVTEFVGAIFDDISRFRGIHPAFSELGIDQMVAGGSGAPLHSGALKYFEDNGLR